MLFSHILTPLLKSNSNIQDIEYCDIAAADMTEYGGHDVRSITDFFNTDFNLIAVGGHTGNDCDPTVFFPKKVKDKCILGFNERGMTPTYLLDKKAFDNPGAFVANSIGGFSQSAGNKLQDYDFVSFRNKSSQISATKHNVSSILSPDCVVLLRRMLDSTISNRVIPTLDHLNGNYIAIQMNSSLVRKHHKSQSLAMKNLIKKTNLPVVFFCAGIARHHDSMDEYVKRFSEILPPDMVYFYDGYNIWDICRVISNAAFVLGTSLHVRVVATAYNRPRATQFPDHADFKAAEFINQWDTISELNIPHVIEYIHKEIQDHDYETDLKQSTYLEDRYLNDSTWLKGFPKKEPTDRHLRWRKHSVSTK